MKKLTILLIFAVPVFTFSQISDVAANYLEIQQGNDTAKVRLKPKTFVTRIALMDSSKPLKRCLYQLNDASIAVVPDTLIKQDFTGEMKSSVYKIDQVNMIKIRRKGSIQKGALIGALSGLAIGAIIVYSARGDSFVIALPCTLSGAIIGGLLGSISIKIPINGNQGTYEKNRKKLERYSVK